MGRHVSPLLQWGHMLDINKNRQIYKDMAAGTSRNLDSPFNEGFSFTPIEYEMLKKSNPSLFDDDPQRRLKAWKEWSQTSEGRAFRVR